MLIWVSLFFIVLAVSLILALRSMRNFKEFPAESKLDYTLYLIKNEGMVAAEFLTEFFRQTHKDYPDLMISLERLFKGSQKALVVFAPRNLIQPYTDNLGLVELEDYSLKEYGQFLVWDMGSKEEIINLGNVLSGVPILSKLRPAEQVWWQVVIKPKQSGDNNFKINIREVVWGETNKDVQDLQNDLTKIDGLLLLPDPSTSEAKLKLYRERAGILPLNVNAGELKKLVEFS